MPHATVWFDGACLGNPGPMGAGAVVEVDGAATTVSRPLGPGTNNLAEYHALLAGLEEALRRGADEVTVHGDSELVLRQVEGRYAVKAAPLVPLHAKATTLLRRFRKAKVEWVPRHANARADALAKAAAEGHPVGG